MAILGYILMEVMFTCHDDFLVASEADDSDSGMLHICAGDVAGSSLDETK